MMLLPDFGYAKQSIQPIIHGKIYPNFSVSLKEFGQPSKINKGGIDSCNESFSQINMYIKILLFLIEA